MEFLIWAGAAVSVAGLAGIFWCIFTVAKAKRAGLEDAELRARLQRIVAINLGALFVSVIGLMMVVVGIFLS
ncbi:hypothetical protein [Thioclava atlantica]|uniref:Uncharacterized protein n=1 Tax=Thioclava atlantica TaxID=1317124 RepID=A0A085TYM2_9RHOB|nr:hypothetical protein [Thioclava atlantica]KFE35819.1 hypothetical protein DW2_04300 [Thioclava atlantica]